MRFFAVCRCALVCFDVVWCRSVECSWLLVQSLQYPSHLLSRCAWKRLPRAGRRGKGEPKPTDRVVLSGPMERGKPDDWRCPNAQYTLLFSIALLCFLLWDGFRRLLTRARGVAMSIMLADLNATAAAPVRSPWPLDNVHLLTYLYSQDRWWRWWLRVEAGCRRGGLDLPKPRVRPFSYLLPLPWPCGSGSLKVLE